MGSAGVIHQDQDQEGEIIGMPFTDKQTYNLQDNGEKCVALSWKIVMVLPTSSMGGVLPSYITKFYALSLPSACGVLSLLVCSNFCWLLQLSFWPASVAIEQGFQFGYNMSTPGY